MPLARKPVLVKVRAPIFVSEAIVDQVGFTRDETLGAKSAFFAQSTPHRPPAA
jgi:hypothetical protein